MKKLSLEEQADEILRMAEESGIKSNFFFKTTLDRYLTQIKNIEDIKQAISKHGTLVTKEYVKGRGNLYVNPAVSEFNRTTDSANKTCGLLLKIIRTFSVGESEEENDIDLLMAAINGVDYNGDDSDD